jgi:hypothetical protein
LVNAGLTLWVFGTQPQFIGLGASMGLLVGFAVLSGLARVSRRKWLAETAAPAAKAP